MRWLEEKEIETIGNTIKFFLFEHNDWDTRERVEATLINMLSELESKEVIYAYHVKCDWRNNPPKVVDTNKLVTDIVIYDDEGNWYHHRFVLGPADIDIITTNKGAID